MSSDAPAARSTANEVAAGIFVEALALPPWRMRLATVPMTSSWWTPSLRMLNAGGPEPFLVGLTRAAAEAHGERWEADEARQCVAALGLAPAKALVAVWWAVFFVVPMLGGVIADALAQRWIVAAARAVIPAMRARHGDRSYEPDREREQRISTYLRPRARRVPP